MKFFGIIIILSVLALGCTSSPEESTSEKIVEEVVDLCGDGVCEYGENYQCKEDCVEGVGGSGGVAIAKMEAFTDGTMTFIFTNKLDEPIFIEQISTHGRSTGIRQQVSSGSNTTRIVARDWIFKGTEGKEFYHYTQVSYKPVFDETNTRQQMSLSGKYLGVVDVKSSLLDQIGKLRFQKLSEEEIAQIMRISFSEEEIKNAMEYPIQKNEE